MLIVSPFGGVLADRLDRRFLMISTQVSQLVADRRPGGAGVHRRVTIWHVLVASLLMGSPCPSTSPPARRSCRRWWARSDWRTPWPSTRMSLNASRILGPSLAGAVMGWAGVAGCLALQSLGYLWAVANVLQIRYGAQRPGPAPGRRCCRT